MIKPCRLELNNSGAWKLLARFDAAIDERTDAIMNAAGALAEACNDPDGALPLMKLRISTDEAHPQVLMRWSPNLDQWVKEAL